MKEPWPIRMTWPLAGRLAVVGVVLNFVWEMAQMNAYTEMAGRSWTSTIWRCLRASIGDGALTMIGVFFSLWVARRPRWAYLTAAAVGTVTAVLVEWTALSVGAWTYNDRMPIVPVLDVGLWPLLQLTILVPVTLWAAQRALGRRH